MYIMYVCACAYKCNYICVCICVYICVCIYWQINNTYVVAVIYSCSI